MKRGQPGHSSKSPRVVVLGGINTDYVVMTPELPTAGQSVLGGDLFTGPGGKGANQAVVAARMGAKVDLIGRVGGEDRGRELVRGLRRGNVGVQRVSFDSSSPSGAAIISVDASGEKQISVALGANMTLGLRQILDSESTIARADVLLANFEVPMSCVLAAAKLAQKHRVKVVIDPAPPTKVPRELFKMVYAIRPNADEAGQMTGIKVKDRSTARRAAQALLSLGAQVVALQAGKQGDLILTRHEEIFVRRVKVKSIDATGAGDAFAGAFAVGIAEGLPLQRVAGLANAAAALATTKLGAQDAMPSRSEVEKLVGHER